MNKMSDEQLDTLGEPRYGVSYFKELIERKAKKGMPSIPDGYLERMRDEE